MWYVMCGLRHAWVGGAGWLCGGRGVGPNETSSTACSCQIYIIYIPVPCIYIYISNMSSIEDMHAAVCMQLCQHPAVPAALIKLSPSLAQLCQCQTQDAALQQVQAEVEAQRLQGLAELRYRYAC